MLTTEFYRMPMCVLWAVCAFSGLAMGSYATRTGILLWAPYGIPIRVSYWIPYGSPYWIPSQIPDWSPYWSTYWSPYWILYWFHRFWQCFVECMLLLFRGFGKVLARLALILTGFGMVCEQVL